MNKRYKFSRIILIVLAFFIGIGALIGSVAMFVDPTGKLLGMDVILPYFQVLPFADVLFSNYIFSGIMLLIVNGITNFVAAGLLLAKRKSGTITSMIFGITLMLWIVIQFVILPANFMSITFFVVGFLQFLTGFICYVGYQQSNFKFDADDYTNIGTNSTKLVIFFSRTGYTKKLAYTIANNQGSEVLEIKTTEKISGNLGFWWCGRFGMHKWGMPIENIDVDFSKYQEITICSPTWVFSVCAPVREFCKQFNGKLNNVNYCITHFMNCKFNKIATEMDNLLGVQHKSFNSYRCRFGKLKEIK